MIRSWLDAAAIYRDRRVLSILALGFASGLPLLLTFSTLSAWLATEGVSRTSIGLFAAVGTPYALKFLWSPLLDGLRPPPLFQKLGQRRGWMVAIQLLLILAVLALGSLTPKAQPLLTALAAVIVAFLSASQDIVIDAYRVEILKPEEQGAGATMVQLGYRIGMLVAGAGVLYLADAFGWHLAYAVMATLLVTGIATALVNSEPAGSMRRSGAARESGWFGNWLRDHVIAPFADFMQRQDWLVIVLFILLYKLADVVAGFMAQPLYIGLGFSLSEIASVSKIFGFFATLLGAFLGGLMVTRLGTFSSLLICGIAQAVTNLAYAAQAMAGHDIGVLAVTIALENVTAGMGSAALVAYLSGLCSMGYTATQYALLSSLTAVGRNWLSTSSGWLADQLGWVPFFGVATLLGLPGLLLLLWLMHREKRPASDRGVAESRAR